MNFTREPITETVITPKEGYKLVVRNSKAVGQEEFFVDAVEVVSFGKAIFFRSLEKPKCFLVPVNDYEILEVRESRMVLKTTGTERGIKIGGGREAPLKVTKEEPAIEEIEAGVIAEQRPDKRRERRRYRKKRGKGEGEEEVQAIPEETPFPVSVSEEKKSERPGLIPPPPTLISETIIRYKELQLEAAEEAKRIIPPPQSRVEPIQNAESNDEDDEIPF